MLPILARLASYPDVVSYLQLHLLIGSLTLIPRSKSHTPTTISPNLFLVIGVGEDCALHHYMAHSSSGLTNRATFPTEFIVFDVAWKSHAMKLFLPNSSCLEW
ncbi:uncharacterized protein LOC131322703 [Rhododendron vialii]|uniref:uncharacterized protein LOC131322703 n=1 Tax=Rhododendron vialii TaxID=182163 RepID=UPI00265F3A6B|nr:uncharacterized protein LOC131322703 [Rhododendron vialii]